MKRLLSIVVISVFSLHFVGFYGYYIFRLIEIRTEMRDQLKDTPLSELQKLDLTLNRYNQSRVGEDEVKIDGKMYDIATLQVKGDRVVIYALHDSDEDSLLSFLDAIIMRSHRDTEPLPSGLFALAGLQYLPSLFQLVQPIFIIQKGATNYLDIDSSFHPKLRTPPPRL